jgi:hypothetical protein
LAVVFNTVSAQVEIGERVDRELVLQQRLRQLTDSLVGERAVAQVEVVHALRQLGEGGGELRNALVLDEVARQVDRHLETFFKLKFGNKTVLIQHFI